MIISQFFKNYFQMKIKRNAITTEPAVLKKAPRRVILGKKFRGRLKDVDVFCDFLEALCHVAIDRCTSEDETSEWKKKKFGPEYEFRKCDDFTFLRHCEESCMLARHYLDDHRLYAFEGSFFFEKFKKKSIFNDFYLKMC